MFLCLRFSYNRRKLDELPFQYFHLHNEIENSRFISDISWVYDKVCGSNCYQILEDMKLQEKLSNEFSRLLNDFIEGYAYVLNYDGRQFYSHLYNYLEEKKRKNEINLNGSNLNEIYSIAQSPPTLSLIPINGETETVSSVDQPEGAFNDKGYDLLTRLPDTEQFIVAVSTHREEILVWDIKK